MQTQKWIDQVFPSAQEQADYKHKHYIPQIDLTADQFQQFMEHRETLIIQKLKQILI
ncbi:hypothetical protein D3C75_1188690 [compost metagenome]